MPSPLASLVVLNWNGANLLPDCIESLRRLAYSPVEIIIVDNGSTDHSADTFESVPGITVIKTGSNLGFAAGMNMGFRVARGQYVAALNNDITVSENWLNDAIDFMEKETGVGIISCRQMNYFKRNVIDSLYSYLHPSLIFFQEGFRSLYVPESSHARPALVLGVSGASTLYRRQLLDEMHGFNESFGSYHEESDLCMRAFLAGWKCVYIPSAVTYHRRSASFSNLKGTMFYLQTRNRLWFIYKYSPIRVMLANIGWILFTEMRILRVVIFREFVFLSYCKGMRDGFSGMLRLRVSRQENMKKLKSRYKEYNELRKKKALAFDGNST